MCFVAVREKFLFSCDAECQKHVIAVKMASGFRSDDQLAEEKSSVELEAFDCYYNNMKLYLNPSTMQGKFISVGLVDGSIIGGGGAVFLPDHMKMETMLSSVRHSIALNGQENFDKLIRALNSVPSYRNLAIQLYSKRL